MRRLVIGVMMVLVASLATCVPSSLPPLGCPPPTSMPTEVATPSRHPTQPSVGPPSDCPHMPQGGFYDVWRNEQVWPRLGCAVALAEAVTGTEAYLCYAIHSLWLREKRLFVVVISPGSWTFVPDESGLPPDAPLMVAPTPQLPKPTPGPPTVTPVPTPTPVALLIRPITTLTPSSHLTRLSVARPPSESGLVLEASPIEKPTPQWPRGCFPATGRHGWLVRQFPGAESGGWSRTSETIFEGAIQQFEGGWLLWNGNVCFVLFADGKWTMF